MRRLFIVVVCCLGLGSCTNPFAPRLAEPDDTLPILGDQTTVEGVFQNFRFAYVFKDTLTYGRLLDRSFSFVFRNYDRVEDVTWGRDEDMLATQGLFNAAQQLDLIWNDVVSQSGDSLVQNISRGFNLTIVFRADDIERSQGRVDLRLERKDPKDPWKIVRWRDDSNFF
ncbi:MAG TPA: hypothetical protein DIS79_06305 [Bacteroidetes bacterium]|nr:hypothetical protein [Bacteroidota bacterium]HRK05498.1 hypothetical protein [Chlorobiota bacterium]